MWGILKYKVRKIIVYALVMAVSLTGCSSKSHIVTAQDITKEDYVELGRKLVKKQTTLEEELRNLTNKVDFYEEVPVKIYAIYRAKNKVAMELFLKDRSNFLEVEGSLVPVYSNDVFKYEELKVLRSLVTINELESYELYEDNSVKTVPELQNWYINQHKDELLVKLVRGFR